MNGWRWTAPEPLAVRSLTLPEAASCVVHTPLSLAAGEATVAPEAIGELRAPPRVVSQRLWGSRMRLRVRSCKFPQPSESLAVPPVIEHVAAPTADPGATPPSWTRIQPPTSVVRLEDRLYYVLQPPLELVFVERALEFPFHPFPYQLEGIAFLYPRTAALLADEMGLGKTMQAITAVRLLLHAGQARAVLLVCPKPLVTNWQREFHAWAPELPVTVVEGDAARRQWQWQLPDTPIRIANYEVVARDREVFDRLAEPYDLVVLDEAQRIKNHASTTAQVVRSIPRRRSWAITGTPLENSPDDLVNIFEFVSPGHLNHGMKPGRMARASADQVLRRTKDQVLKDLPPKLFRDAEIELSSAQRESYRLAEEQGVLRLAEMGEEATIRHVFELVLRLKQICNFDPATGESAKLERLAADLEEVADSGRKAIVFSQWVETLETLAAKLAHFRPLEYHGKVPGTRRDAILQQFRDDAQRSVLLLSYGAGGVGLNLQFAGYVFLFDRWWNPAVEDQAINRAHRIGAAGPVTVTRFLATGTIEQRIDQILQEKRELFDTVFNDAQAHEHSGLTQRELFGLFKLKCPTGPIRLAS
ncbi:MAG TPA: DEAD/DEAH box helicase [Pirellulales bacterium]|jgi:SNF2 family DNA or RNA helicase|nr:DEAD/DEAH box helicase [Pirellulales bacterium]